MKPEAEQDEVFPAALISCAPHRTRDSGWPPHAYNPETIGGAQDLYPTRLEPKDPG